MIETASSALLVNHFEYGNVNLRYVYAKLVMQKPEYFIELNQNTLKLSVVLVDTKLASILRCVNVTGHRVSSKELSMQSILCAECLLYYDSQNIHMACSNTFSNYRLY